VTIYVCRRWAVLTCMAVPSCKVLPRRRTVFITRLMAVATLWLPTTVIGFNPKWRHVGFLVDEVTLKLVILRVSSGFPSLIFTPPLRHTHLSLPPEICDNLDQAAHCIIRSASNFRAQSQTVFYTLIYVCTICEQLLLRWMTRILDCDWFICVHSRSQ
jgi:hypothetical protein